MSTRKDFWMKIDVAGVEHAMQNLSMLSVKEFRHVVARALTAGSTPTLKKLKANVKAFYGKRSKDNADDREFEEATGALLASIGRKVHTKRSTGVTSIHIGALRGVYAQEADGEPRRPSRYFHLLEKGVRGSFAGFGMLREAVDSTREQVKSRTIQYLKSGFDRAVSRAQSRATKKAKS